MIFMGKEGCPEAFVDFGRIGFCVWDSRPVILGFELIEIGVLDLNGRFVGLSGTVGLRLFGRP